MTTLQGSEAAAPCIGIKPRRRRNGGQGGGGQKEKKKERKKKSVPFWLRYAAWSNWQMSTFVCNKRCCVTILVYVRFCDRWRWLRKPTPYKYPPFVCLTCLTFRVIFNIFFFSKACALTRPQIHKHTHTQKQTNRERERAVTEFK